MALTQEEKNELQKKMNREARTAFEKMHKTDIYNLLNKTIEKFELPEGSLYLNYDEQDKKEALHSIYIYEPEYPLVNKANRDPKMNTVCMAIKAHQMANKQIYLDINVHDDQYDYVCLHCGDSSTWNIIKELNAPKGWTKVRIPLSLSDNLIDFMTECIEYSIRNYQSKATRFGCCSHFEECSDAKKCVHPNKLYGCACYYKANLDQGKIFYGKNRNID